MALEEGHTIGHKYQIERLLGEGGMGSVYVAKDTVLQRNVALKVMSERFAALEAAAQRFQREAITASRVSHPSIVQVFDAGEHEGQPWIAMELLDGESLGDRLERGPMPLPEVLTMASGVLSALAEVHQEGIVHRDLKPDNIFLARTRGREGFVPKVLDFGVAKDTADGQLSKLTATGAVVGTAYYLSPEQAKGQPDIDARTDVYAMGVVLFECLSGDMPFEAETITQLIAKMFSESPRDLRVVAPHVPGPVAEVINTCLEGDRDRRFQTARGLLGALEAAAAAIASPGFAATGIGPGLASPMPLGHAGTAVAGGVSAPGMGSMPGQHPAPSLPSGPGMPSAPGMSHPGMSHPGMSQPAFPQTAMGAPMQAPQRAGTAVMHGSAPGLPPGSQGGFGQPGMSQPGASHPGMHGSHPGSQPGYGMHGSQPGYGSQGGFAPPKKSRGGMIALVLLLFVLGAGGTLAAVFVMMGDDSGEASAQVDAEPADVEDEEPTVAPPEPTEPAAAVSPSEPLATPDPPDDPEEPGAEPVEPEPSEPSHAGRRRRNRRQTAAADRDPEPTTNPGLPPPDMQPDRNPRPDPRPARPQQGLAPAQVMSTVQSHTTLIQRRCYERLLARNPGLRGVVTVSWTIQANGRVTNPSVVHDNTGDPRLSRCTAQVVAGMVFPRAANGNTTSARYPFQFN